MADEPKPADTKDASPAFDPKAIEAMVQGAVRTSIEAMVKEGQTKQAVAAEDQAAADAAKKAAASDPMSDMFKPVLEPALAAARAAETRALLAQDAVDFYTTNAADPVVQKYKAKIEEVVTTQMKRGNLISRRDAFNWLRGGELFDEIQKDTLTEHETKIKAAQAAATAGPSVAVPKFTKPIDQLNTDELATALKDVTF